MHRSPPQKLINFDRNCSRYTFSRRLSAGPDYTGDLDGFRTGTVSNKRLKRQRSESITDGNYVFAARFDKKPSVCYSVLPRA